MVAKDEPQSAGGGAKSVGLVRNSSDSSQTSTVQRDEKGISHIDLLKFVTVQADITTAVNSKKMRRKTNNVRGKKITRPLARSPRNIARGRRLSSTKSPNARTSVKQPNENGSKVFMEPPTRESAANQSSTSRSTRTGATTLPSSSSFTAASASTRKTLTKVTRASRTKTSEVFPSLIAPAPTRSFGSHISNRISKISLKMSGSFRPSSGSVSSTQQKAPPYYKKPTYSSNKEPKPDVMTVKLTDMKEGADWAKQSMTRRSGDSDVREPRLVTGSLRPRTPKKVTTLPLMAAGNPPTSTDVIPEANKPRGSQKSETPTEGKKGKKKGKSKPSTATSDTRKSAASRGSKRSKKSKGSKASGKGKKGKKGKEKVKKLNRKAIYKELKAYEKKLEDEAKNRKIMEWEKHKLYVYWNCVVNRLLDLQKRNHNLKKKEASLKMEKKDGMFHQNWKTMNLARLQREECLDLKRAEFRSMIRELRDSHKRQTDWLFKDIQTYVKDTYLVGQKYVNDVVGIRMEYTKGLTDTMFEARENLRVLEIEQNAKYGPALEEFEEQMRKLRSKIPTERQERLQKMLAESNGMLVELVNVYTTILHHNFIEVCHTANIINELKSVERRLEREMSDIVKKRDKIKERTEYLNDRVSNLRRQVNAGKEARKKLHRVMKEQEALHGKIDLAYIAKEITFQENTRLTAAHQEMSERVDKWYIKVKRDFMKDIILEAAKHEERASELLNYNHLVRYLFNVEADFLESIENFKDHEEVDDQEEGLKVLLGVYRPHTIYDLEREFEGCTESFTTAIIFFKRRLQQHYMSLDDLHFFIRRRSPLSYLNTVRKEELELKQLMSFVLGSVYGHVRTQPGGALLAASSNSFKL